MRRKIAVVTGTRADYGLLYWLMKEIELDQELELQVVVTGSHLERKYGLTKDIINSDGFKISAEVNCQLISDRPDAIVNSIAECMKGMSITFQKLQPDIVVILGDRFEILGVAQACLIGNVPLAHIHGGESTEGLIDDNIRHALTKMSHVHFCANQIYRQRIIQMGENPSNVFDYGAPGLDNMTHLKLLERDELEIFLGFSLKEHIVLVTYHPVTLDEKISNQEITNFIKALSKLEDKVQIIITLPNADTYSEFIRFSWEQFKSTRENCYIYTNLGQLRYLSLMKHSTVIAGNSSSGIVEAPFLGKSVVNVGVRQRGRISSKEHVINVEAEEDQIFRALEVTLSTDFRKKSSQRSLLYGDGHTSKKIKNELKRFRLTNALFKKFHDLGV